MNNNDRSIVRVATGVGAAIVVCLVAVVAFLEFALDLRWFREPLHSVSVSGTVVDAASNEPVANARVIVAVMRRDSLKAAQHRYGIETDAKGDFEFARTTPFGLSSLVTCHVCAPDGRVGYSDTFASPDDEKYVAVFNVSIPPNAGRTPVVGASSYINFSGVNCSAEIEFIGDNWLGQ